METQLDLFPDDTILRNASPKVIALSGRAGSGKSLASETLVQAGWKRVKFADGLKNMLRSLYDTAGLTLDEIERRLEGDLKEQPDPLLKGKTPRWAMQSLGNEWGRELIHRDLWLSLAIKAVRNHMSVGYNVVVDDCRYVNEADAVRNIGGSVWLVKRPVPLPKGFVTQPHESERFEFEPDGTIFNTGSPTDLAQNVKYKFL